MDTFEIKLNKIQELLIQYTSDVFTDMTLQKLGVVRLVYGIIRQAIGDLHGTTEEYSVDSREYFDSYLFTYHCELVGINKEVMLHIARNPQDYLDSIRDYSFDEVENESDW